MYHKGVDCDTKSSGVYDSGEMEHSNHTTPHSPTTTTHKTDLRGYYALIPFVLFTVLGCAVAVVAYIRKRIKFDKLRHRLIPLYRYDPAEQQEDWEDASRGDGEEGLDEPLYTYGQLSVDYDSER